MCSMGHANIRKVSYGYLLPSSFMDSNIKGLHSSIDHGLAHAFNLPKYIILPKVRRIADLIKTLVLKLRNNPYGQKYAGWTWHVHLKEVFYAVTLFNLK